MLRIMCWLLEALALRVSSKEPWHRQQLTKAASPLCDSPSPWGTHGYPGPPPWLGRPGSMQFLKRLRELRGAGVHVVVS